MRLFLVSLYVVSALSKPQSYSYQQQNTLSSGDHELTEDQLQTLHQYVQQQQQQQTHQLQQLDHKIILLQYPDPQLHTTQSQTVSQGEENGGYHYTPPLLSQGQHALHLEPQQEPQIPQTSGLNEQRISEAPNVATVSENPLESHISQNSPASQIIATAQAPQLTPSLQVLHAPQNRKAQTEQLLNEQLHQPFEQTKSAQHVRQETEIPHSSPAIHEPVPQEVVTSSHQAQPHLQYSHSPQHLTPYSQPAHRQPTVSYNKEFFYLSAPQEDFETPEGLEDQLSQMKKNIRVVFIKAPEQNGITKAALQLAQQSVDSQTAIYILTKQHDAADFANKVQQIRGTAQNKPEVIFIKYRTPAEAEQAQRTIQAQYEALEGPNYFNHEGVAPTHSFVGGGAVDPHSGSTAHGVHEPTATPARKYLPSATKH